MPQAAVTDAYQLAQRAMADLKAAAHAVLTQAGDEGCTNAQVGRLLGIYTGHVGHEGHVSRTILGILESEGVAVQERETRKWHLRKHLGHPGSDSES